MKKLTMIFVMITITILLVAKTSDITGTWLMTKAEMGKKTEYPYFVTTFKTGGNMETMGIKIGTWEKKGDYIVTHSKFDKDFNGENKIIELTDKNLILEKEGNKYFYRKLDTNRISKDNKISELAGLWKLKDSQTYLKFDLPDSMIYLSYADGVTDTYRGKWIFMPKENNVIILGFLKKLKGKNKILKISDKKLSIKNNDKIYDFVKQKSETIEKLSYKYEDFDEDADFSAKLPWQDYDKMINVLKNIKEIKYDYAKYMPDVQTFNHGTIISEIKVNQNKNSVRFINFSVTKNNKEQFSEKYKDELSEAYNLFFPEEEPMPYRVVGTQKITVPAGTFECTVVEGIDGEKQIKYWMINDKPGIYAKKIKQELSPFGEFDFYKIELLEMK